MYGERKAPPSVIDEAKALFRRAHETVDKCAHCDQTRDQVGRGEWKQHLIDCERIAQGVTRRRAERTVLAELAEDEGARRVHRTRWSDDR